MEGEPDRLSRVEALLEAQQRQIDELTAENRRLRSRREPDAAADDGERDAPTVGRRRLLLGGAAAGAAAVAGVLATAQPAAAADDDPVVLGFDANESTSLTKINYFGSGAVAFEVDARSGSGDAIVGQSASLAGVVGVSESSYGVYGESAANGVTGLSTGDGNGVYGQAGETGVAGVSTNGGTGTTGFAFGSGTGMIATSQEGTGLIVEGRTTLQLQPQSGRAAPVADAFGHERGEVVIDGAGAVWLCIAAGTPGTWRKIGGPSTSGQLHVLPAPARVYDSRPGGSPSSVGPKTRFTANETRTFDLKVNSSGVPAGATAALVTILLVNASATAGNATLWALGVAKPAANTLVWGGTAGRFTASAVTALDAQARVQFNASQSTDLVLDVVGYYR